MKTNNATSWTQMFNPSTTWTTKYGYSTTSDLVCCVMNNRRNMLDTIAKNFASLGFAIAFRREVAARASR